MARNFKEYSYFELRFVLDDEAKTLTEKEKVEIEALIKKDVAKTRRSIRSRIRAKDLQLSTTKMKSL